VGLPVPGSPPNTAALVSLCGQGVLPVIEVELPIHFSDRAEGKSKMSLKVQLESAMMPFKLRRYVR
jgi:hypothetical protein